jgi:plasmid stabilization system protein ParE
MELTAYWTQFAEDKLEDIFSYYCAKASYGIVQKIIEELIEKSLELEKNPFIGQKELLLEKRMQEFRYLVCKNYKIIYWVNQEKERIEILNVFDCRQNPDKIDEI